MKTEYQPPAWFRFLSALVIPGVSWQIQAWWIDRRSTEELVALDEWLAKEIDKT